MIVPGQAYTGIVYAGIDLEKNNKYPVYIRQLSIPGQLTIFFATNEILGNTFSRWIDPMQHASQESSKLSSGAYFPLHRGMKVEVKFRTDDITDGYITKIINNQGSMPLSHNLKDDFYLVCKTVNDSYLYIDENRQVMHMMNSNGRTNLLLDSDRVVLHAGELLNGGAQGVKNDSIIEVTTSGISLKFGKSYIKIDDSGIVLSAGEKSKSYLQITEAGIRLGADEDVIIRSEKNLNVIGQHLYTTGIEDYNIHSTNTKISGAQMLTLTGNTVSIDSALETYIKGSHIGIDALMKLNLSGLMIDVNALSTLYLESIMYTNKSEVSTTKTDVLVNASSVIMNDGIVMSNMQMATSAAESMAGVQMAMSTATEAAAAALTIGMGMNDPVSGTIANIMNSTLSGAANPANNLLSLPTLVPLLLDGASSSVSYINGYNTEGNKYVLSPLPTPITI